MTEKKATKAASKPTTEVSKAKTSKMRPPNIQEFLKAGVQFGHETKKWNPKMKKYIFANRDKIHIIDISKTISQLGKALSFLSKAAVQAPVLVVGTKRQASEIVKQMAVDSGCYYIVHRWPGGLLTNFKMIKKSLKRFNELEQEFEKGIEDRTKFEVSQMKKDWEKMNRLYEGIKDLNGYPSAVVVVDTHYEKNAVKESRGQGIPIIGIVDTNSDPDGIDYPIPANDDAIRSVGLLVGLMGEAIKIGNEGKGIKHRLKDYSKYEVKLIKKEVKEEERQEISIDTTRVIPRQPPIRVQAPPRKSTKSVKEAKGLLEGIQEDAESKKTAKAKKARKVSKQS